MRQVCEMNSYLVVCHKDAISDRFDDLASVVEFQAWPPRVQIARLGQNLVGGRNLKAEDYP